MDWQPIDKLPAGKRLTRARTNVSMTPEDSQEKSAPQDKNEGSQGAPAGDTLAATDAHSASVAGVSDARAGAERAGAGSSPPAPPAAAGDPAAKAAAAPVAVKPAPAAGAPAAVKAAAPQPPTPPPPPKPQPINEFDPLGWDVPLICKDCDKPFVVPYRNFLAGVVFHCPSCQGSWVPSTTIAKEMRQVFEDFWGPRKRPRGFRARRAEARSRRVRAAAGGRAQGLQGAPGAAGGGVEAGRQAGAAQGPRGDVHLAALINRWACGQSSRRSSCSCSLRR
jgi:hypothetical protein